MRPTKNNGLLFYTKLKMEKNVQPVAHILFGAVFIAQYIHFDRNTNHLDIYFYRI